MKNVLITGTNSGFGLLTSVELAKCGYQVIATMRDLNKKGKLIEHAKAAGVENSIHILQLDITKIVEITSAFQKIEKDYGQIDILINNAGYAQGGFFEEITDESWFEQFQTNFFGHIQVTRTFLPLLRKSSYGKIINISSISGIFGFPGLSPYTSSKFALEGWSESLRLELRKENIFVVLVEAAAYQTNIWNKGLRRINFEKSVLIFNKSCLKKHYILLKMGQTHKKSSTLLFIFVK